MERFSGEVVVVTGASSGVGRAIAQAFGAAGARVALLARNEEALRHAAAEIEAVVPGRPDNLVSPVPGDRGAHGRFDARSRRFSPELWVRLHRGAIVASLAAVAVLVTTARASRR